MRETLQFEEGEITVIMMWYLGHPELTLEQLRAKLNAKLREKAKDALAHEMVQNFTKGRAPNCF